MDEVFLLLGQEDYSRLRPLRNRGTDIFVLVFSLFIRASYENILKEENILMLSLNQLLFFQREAMIVIVPIFQGLVYLNKRLHKIIHYDLKPGNVLFDEDGVAKVTDFGLSKIAEDDVGSRGMELTLQGAEPIDLRDGKGYHADFRYVYGTMSSKVMFKWASSLTRGGVLYSSQI